MKHNFHNIFSAILIAALIPALWCTGVDAQTGVSFSWILLQDDNTYKSMNEYDEMINTASLMLSRGYTIGSASFQAFYSIDKSIFKKNNEQQNMTHKFGLFSKFRKGIYSTDVGFYGQLRRNDAQYIYYNTNIYNFYLKTEIEPSMSKLYTLGLNYGNSAFNEFAELDNTNYRAYFKYQQFFQNRFSVSGELGLNIKEYTNQSQIEMFGIGGMAGQIHRYRESSVNSVQFSTDFNIGKSLADRTGLNFGGGVTRFLGEPIASYLDGIYYYTENDIFDDPGSYEQTYASLALTQQFALGFQGKIGMLLKGKDYAGTPAINELGNLTDFMREDTRREYSFMISKKFNADFPISTFFNFMIRNNDSNDLYYSFSDHIGMVGLTISK